MSLINAICCNCTQSLLLDSKSLPINFIICGLFCFVSSLLCSKLYRASQSFSASTKLRFRNLRRSKTFMNFLFFQSKSRFFGLADTFLSEKQLCRNFPGTQERLATQPFLLWTCLWIEVGCLERSKAIHEAKESYSKILSKTFFVLFGVIKSCWIHCQKQGKI